MVFSFSIICLFVSSPESVSSDSWSSSGKSASSSKWGSGDGASWGSSSKTVSSSDGSSVDSDDSGGWGSSSKTASSSEGSSVDSGSNWGSSSYGSYSWGSISLDRLLDSGVYNGLLNGDSLLVDDWGFNNLLDWVPMVGLSDWDSTWYSNFVWFWDMYGV